MGKIYFTATDFARFWLSLDPLRDRIEPKRISIQIDPKLLAPSRTEAGEISGSKTLRYRMPFQEFLANPYDLREAKFNNQPTSELIIPGTAREILDSIVKGWQQIFDPLLGAHYQCVTYPHAQHAYFLKDLLSRKIPQSIRVYFHRLEVDSKQKSGMINQPPYYPLPSLESTYERLRQAFEEYQHYVSFSINAVLFAHFKGSSQGRLARRLTHWLILYHVKNPLEASKLLQEGVITFINRH